MVLNQTTLGRIGMPIDDTMNTTGGSFMLYIKKEEMIQVMQLALEKEGCDEKRAKEIAQIVTENTMDGSSTHGANRFPRLLDEIGSGVVDLAGGMKQVSRFGGLEVWDGGFGFGVLNANIAMNRAIELAKEHGIGCVSLRNSNHWMRPGRYGWMAAEAGMIGICWSNTSGNMPVWGAKDARMGNNPIVISVPSAKGPVMVDMAMSQFSNGKMEVARQKGEQMPMPCGWDQEGNLTTDPDTVLKSKRLLQTGYWKGSSFAMIMDFACVASSLGMSTPKIDEIKRQKKAETGHSQMFIAINCAAVADPEQAGQLLMEAEQAYLDSEPDGSGTEIRISGQTTLQKRAKAEVEGVPVLEATWKKILEKACSERG